MAEQSHLKYSQKKLVYQSMNHFTPTPSSKYSVGDTVFFRCSLDNNEIRDDFFRGCLFVGLVRSIEEYLTTNKDHLKTQYFLHVHVSGRCIPSEIYCDRHERRHESNHNEKKNIDLSAPLNKRRRDMLSKALDVIKSNRDYDFDTGEREVAKMNDLEMLIFAARNIKVGEGNLNFLKHVRLPEERAIRPSHFHNCVNLMINMFGIKRSQALMTVSFRTYRQRIRKMTEERISAVVVLQKYGRMYNHRDTLVIKRKRRDWEKVHHNFLSSYVTSSNKLHTACYSVKGAQHVFLLTQAMSNEWAIAMKNAIATMARFSRVSIHSRLRESLRRLKGACTFQKEELERMFHEEIYCVL